MRSSLVPMPPGSRLIVLRAPYLALCGGDTAPAILLDILVFYTDLRHQQDASELWLPFTYQQFIDESLDLLKDHDVRRGLAFLRTSGLIQSRNGAVAHTLEYWVDVAMLRELLDVSERVVPALNPLQVTDQSVTGNGSSVNSALTTTRFFQPRGGSLETETPHVAFPKPPPRGKTGRPEPEYAKLGPDGEELAPRYQPARQSNLALKIARACGAKSLTETDASMLRVAYRWPSETAAALGDHVVQEITPDELFDTPLHPCHDEFVEYLDRYIAKVKRAIQDNGKNKLAKPSRRNTVSAVCNFVPFDRSPKAKIPTGGADVPTKTSRKHELSADHPLTHEQLLALVPEEFRGAELDV